MKASEIYFNTLSETIEAAFHQASVARAVMSPEDTATFHEVLGRDPLNYSSQRRCDFPLVSYKGRGTRKFFHVIIDRNDRGTYELNTYVL